MASPFVWHELLTSDAQAALSFYSALFGWSVVDDTLVVGGRALAGVRMVKLAPHWAPFVRVADPEAAARACAAAGGRVAGRPSTPAGVVLVDPRGVPTVVTSHDGADLFAWHILESTDVTATAAWIETITGWRAPAGRGLWRDDEQVGSLVAASHDRWLGLLLVDDRLAIRERALALGAHLEQGDIDASGHGYYDVLADPQGAVFCPF